MSRSLARGDAGDPGDLLRRIAKRHLRAMTNVALRFEQDPRDVEEIVADAMELAHQHRDQLADASDAQVRGWLLNTVRYLSLNHLRRSVARKRAFERLAREPLPLAPQPDDEFGALDESHEAALESARVAEVLAGLRSEDRVVLVMDSLDSTGAEIGAAIGTSAATARKRLERARHAFRVAWSETPTVVELPGGDIDA